MQSQSYGKQVLLVAVVLGLSVSANLPEGVLAAWSVNRTVLLIALGLTLMVALVRYVKFALVLVIAILAIGANLPDEMAAYFGTSPTILTITLVATVLLALLNYLLNILPTGVEVDPARRETTQDGAEALINATRRGDVRYMRALLRLGVDPDHTGLDGTTALTTAAGSGYTDAVQLLLHHGADPQRAGTDGRPPARIARAAGYNRAADLIEAHTRFPEGSRPSAEEMGTVSGRSGAPRTAI